MDLCEQTALYDDSAFGYTPGEDRPYRGEDRGDYIGPEEATAIKAEHEAYLATLIHEPCGCATTKDGRPALMCHAHSELLEARQDVEWGLQERC